MHKVRGYTQSLGIGVLIILILFGGFSDNAFGQSIHGLVYDSHENKTLDFVSITLWKPNSKKYSFSDLTDDSGRFTFQNLPQVFYDVHVSFVGYEKKVIRKIDVRRDTTLIIDLYTPCPNATSKDNKVCPKCFKTDQVIPIKYGLLIYKDSLSRSQEGIDFYVGGCEVIRCDPLWWCKRDSLKF